MSKSQFHDEFTLSETAVKFGKKALDLKLIPSFFVRYFPDSQQFYIPNEDQGEPLTPEEAYLRLKQLVEQSEG
ncbi:MAG TPA: hypothetical protein DCE56_11610 [Cyanobacteria bacterium UBA8553]|nr:hypothetical protein [Cyanobacteria bacterium UBA8553]HAJ58043.1 hypothetical protein [Cyanobacteria bacterium UBA8543]